MKALLLLLALIGSASLTFAQDPIPPKSIIVQKDISPTRIGVKYRLFDDDGFEHFDIYGWDSSNKRFQFCEKHHASGMGPMPKMTELNREIIRARLSNSLVSIKMQEVEGQKDKFYSIEIQGEAAKELSELPVSAARIKLEKINLKSSHNSYYYFAGFIYVDGVHIRTFHYKDPSHYGTETPDPMADIEKVMEKAISSNGSVYMRNIGEPNTPPVFELVP